MRALLSLGGTVPEGRWNFAADGPCDVLLADPRGADVREAQAQRGARTVLLLANEKAGEDVLQRPLRAEQLETCLRRAAQHILGSRVAHPMPAVASQPTMPQRRYRLLRWPPGELLRGEPQRIRMASQMSRRFLSVDELAQLTQGDAQRCLTFVQLLLGFGLVEAEDAAAVAPARPVAAAPASARPAGGLSLIRSIRRRLGL